MGETRTELHPGDTVDIAPELKHRHGAAKDSCFSHIAIEVPAQGATTEWLEAVDDTTYGSLK